MNDEQAHDLRHWLTALMGALDSGDTPLARGIAEQMAALLGAPAPAPVSLNGLLPLLGPIRAIPADPDIVPCADPAALARVLMNLTANARQAMTDGDLPTVRISRDGASAVVAVQDTGPGIAPDVLTRLFDRGFTTRSAQGGQGLGLAIVRDLVEAAGGTVSAASAIGHGTTISVRWPLEGDGPAGATILLVEDEPIARQLAEQALRRKGFAVEAAASAEAALLAAERVTPAAVVADLTLPGMDGRTLIGVLRRKWPNLPALLVSGYADSASRADPANRKTVFLAKPYALDGLVAAVGALVRD